MIETQTVLWEVLVAHKPTEEGIFSTFAQLHHLKNQLQPSPLVPLSGVWEYQEILRSSGAAQFITLQGLPFFTVRFKPRHQKLSSLRSSNTKTPVIMVGFSLFSSKLSSGPFNLFILEQMTYYAMKFPCNCLLQNSPMFHNENSGPHKHSWDGTKQRN